MEGSPVHPLWQLILSGMLGLTYVLAGYRTMRFTARLTSGLLFMTLGALVATHIHHPAATAAIVAASAVIGFLVGNAFYFVNVAAFGAAAGAVIAAVIVAALGGTVGWIAGLSGALVGTVLAILFERPIGIVGTSVVGAALTMAALQLPLVLIGTHGPRSLAWSSTGLFVGLTLLGSLLQAGTTRNLPERPKNPGAAGARRV